MIVVDRLAPDFEGTAYFNGKVTKVKLLDYKGRCSQLSTKTYTFPFIFEIVRV